jgi:hypothetical protein
VQNNRIYSNGVPNGVQALRGIDFDTVGDGAVIRYNEIYSNTFDGIELDAGSDAAVYGNLIYKNGNFGVRAFADWQTSMTGVLVYNNTVYGNQNGGIKLMGPTGSAHGTCTNNAVINNIVVNTIDGPNLAVSKGCENLTEAAGDSGSGNIYTFNALGVASKKFIQWGSASESTYEAWETAAGNCGEKGCSHSVESDPLLTSASLNDFTLSSNSPAIGVGLNLGELYEEGLSTTSSWPSDVLLNNQNESTGGWSIGAYTYP